MGAKKNILMTILKMRNNQDCPAFSEDKEAIVNTMDCKIQEEEKTIGTKDDYQFLKAG